MEPIPGLIRGQQNAKIFLWFLLKKEHSMWGNRYDLYFLVFPMLVKSSLLECEQDFKLVSNQQGKDGFAVLSMFDSTWPYLANRQKKSLFIAAFKELVGPVGKSIWQSWEYWEQPPVKSLRKQDLPNDNCKELHSGSVLSWLRWRRFKPSLHMGMELIPLMNGNLLRDQEQRTQLHSIKLLSTPPLI